MTLSGEKKTFYSNQLAVVGTGKSKAYKSFMIETHCFPVADKLTVKNSCRKTHLCPGGTMHLFANLNCNLHPWAAVMSSVACRGAIRAICWKPGSRNRAADSLKNLPCVWGSGPSCCPMRGRLGPCSGFGKCHRSSNGSRAWWWGCGALGGPPLRRPTGQNRDCGLGSQEWAPGVKGRGTRRD